MTTRSPRRSTSPSSVRLVRLGQPAGVRALVGDLGPDRRPYRPAQGDLRGRHALEPRHHRLGDVAVFWMLLACRAVVGVGEGAFGPSANALLCAAAPPEKRGRALGIYNIGMAFGATSGLVLGNALAPEIGWRNVFWIAGGPSILLAAAAAFVAAPARLRARRSSPPAHTSCRPTYLIALAGGILSTFGASALVVWAQSLIVGRGTLAHGRQRLHGRRRARARYRRRRRRWLPG